MKIVVAPNAFKGCCTATEAARAMARGIRQVEPEAEIILLPIADGGDGTAHTLVEATRGELFREEVVGPLQEPVFAQWGLLGDGSTAIIEIAEASGLTLVPEEDRDPWLATSYGTGELIDCALDRRARKIIVGLGGSATVDGGLGMARALGAVFYDDKDEELYHGGEALSQVARVDVSGMDGRLEDVSILCACDVKNPLTGRDGATRVYGPQKGADEDMVEDLEDAMCRYADIVERDTGVRVHDLPGAGAAGGIAAALVAFCGAEIHSGVEIVLEATGFADQLDGADLMIVGEGRLDGSTLHGKAPAVVSRLGKSRNVAHVMAVCGQVLGDVDGYHDFGIDSVHSILSRATSIEDSIENALDYLELVTRDLLRQHGENGG